MSTMPPPRTTGGWAGESPCISAFPGTPDGLGVGSDPGVSYLALAGSGGGTMFGGVNWVRS